MCHSLPLPRQAGKFSGEVGTTTDRVYKNISKLSRGVRMGTKQGKSFEGGAGWWGRTLSGCQRRAGGRGAEAGAGPAGEARSEGRARGPEQTGARRSTAGGCEQRAAAGSSSEGRSRCGAAQH